MILHLFTFFASCAVMESPSLLRFRSPPSSSGLPPLLPPGPLTFARDDPAEPGRLGDPGLGVDPPPEELGNDGVEAPVGRFPATAELRAGDPGLDCAATTFGEPLSGSRLINLSGMSEGELALSFTDRVGLAAFSAAFSATSAFFSSSSSSSSLSYF